MATALDPTGLAASHGNVIKVESLSGINLVLLFFGLAMVVLGVIIRIVAIATLKKNFSGRLRIRDDHTLVTNGIYQWVRHPAYLGANHLIPGHTSNGLQCSRIPSDVPACALPIASDQTRGEDAHRAFRAE